ncbi:phasin family protein [Paenibacillus doosanensis]|uniref:Poly(Hydroxyalcanoate) granule associated protein (Phasin) n=1 Tax=Paenibacillus konkukensis TaxID=2020716 RepID=A0ABY4RES2_9BACL|nr:MULTISPECIES: phasin family protein [Paenibacillus]MCS7462315.1 phasin family protein [Paenibacillus doosanensis]UQZ80873.1 Poly(hydroxyalcanoate) granule associated protein (phasin) [Paenibacillus konkukensis]
MKDLFGKAVSLGLGFAVASKEQAEKFVDELVKKGELNKAESQQFVDELVRKGQEAQSSLETKVRGYIRQALHEMNLTTKDDYVRLTQRIGELERRVAELEGQTKGPGQLPPPSEL